jgi:IS5 family transposase
VTAFEDCVTVEQHDSRAGRLHRITLSPAQVADLAAALNLPEGSYRLQRRQG